MPARHFSKFWLAVIGIILLTVVTRLPSLMQRQAIDDESVYSVVANEIVDGGRPYADAVERKPPLLFWTYAAVFDAAGKYNWRALHIVALAWTLLTMTGLYLIGSSLFDRSTGLVAALLYGIFQPWAVCKNQAFNGELLMNLPIAWAWAIAFRRSSSVLRPELFAAGALLCLGFLLKQPAAISAVPLGIYLLLPGYRDARGLTRSQSIVQAALLTVGFFGMLGLISILLWKQDILGEAIYWTIGDHAIRQMFWHSGMITSLYFAGCCLPLLVGAVLSDRTGNGIWIGKSAERTALLTLIAASIVGVVAGSRFYPHYYIQLVLPLAVFAAPFYTRLWSGEIKMHNIMRPAVTYAWLGLTVVGFLIGNFIGADLEGGPGQTGQYLLEHSTPTDRIFVWGHRPKIYLDAQRRPACRYITTFPLTGYLFGGAFPGLDTRKWIKPWAWKALDQDFARHPPVYIVDTQTSSRARYPVKDFPVLARLLAEKYRPVAETDDAVVYAAR
jgi:4-amino-4-deoxy-L-arabinose transferase-like glycosyltransferase